MKPRDLAGRMRARRDAAKLNDGYKRETFTLPLEEARVMARRWLDRYPAAGYASKVETWARLPNGDITFTMRRLPSSD